MKILFLLLLCITAISASAQDSTQSQLIGKYKFPDGSVVAEVNVVFESGNLMMNSSAGVSALELIKGDSFNIVNFNGTAVFKRNDVKKVIGVHIEASGYVLDGVKDSVGVNKVNAAIVCIPLSANNKWMKDRMDWIAAKDFSPAPADGYIIQQPAPSISRTRSFCIHC